MLWMQCCKPEKSTMYYEQERNSLLKNHCKKNQNEDIRFEDILKEKINDIKHYLVMEK